MNFNGKRVVVTGASGGIGRELVRTLVEQGAFVAASGRSLPDLEQTRALAAHPAQVYLCPGDLRHGADRLGIAAEALKQLGEVDVIVNVAGVWHDAQRKYQGPLAVDTPPDEIDEVLDVGLKGAFQFTRLILPSLIRCGSGKVIFFSCGFSGPAEAVGWLHYYVANKAVEALVAGLSIELRPHNIQVNAVAPWFVATEAVRCFYPDQITAALAPRDVVDAVLFLASARADQISGQTIELRSKSDF